MTTATKTRPKPPPPSNGNGRAKQEPARAKKQFSVTKGVSREFIKVGIYGKGGTGKTSLALLLSKLGIKTLMIDLEGGSEDFDVDARISSDQIETFEDLRDILHDKELLADYQAIIVDPLINVQFKAAEYVLRTIKKVTKNGSYNVTNLRDYGWDDGSSHLYDTMQLFFADLDIVNRTHHVVTVSHAIDDMAANATGDDFLAYFPLMNKSRKGDIRSRYRDWCNDLFFLELERHIDEKTGKVYGDGTRIIHPIEMPHAWAKSKKVKEDIVWAEGDPVLWEQLLK